MIKTVLTLGLNDKDKEIQVIPTTEAKQRLANILINDYGVYAFTMWDVQGAYRMESTGNIIFENSIRVEIASDTPVPVTDICNTLKTVFNQECIMIEASTADISFE